MSDNKRKIFNDPVHGFITIPHELIFDIIEHPYFQRLRRIQQLGLSSYVYPGANHTRFHHALGAFHLMRKAISILKIKGHAITEEEELAANIAILLHDIGHGPFSHTLENILVKDVHHEELSKIYMHRLNSHFGGKLTMAISIFEGKHTKKFLHQLVSSQLDVDRLDYLTRDSFFTGVSEGVISYDRIIEMMNVSGDELVIEKKGIYSIENFIISRRLMYWQVYLHKTVVCVENMLVRAIERAQQLRANGVKMDASPALTYFFDHAVKVSDFTDDHEVLELYSRLDDMDIMSALKYWRHSDDPILRLLCASILDRRLFKIQMRARPFAQSEVDAIIAEVAREYGVSLEDASYLAWTDSTTNHAYNPAEDRISILTSDGRVTDIAQASDQFNITGLSEPVVKYYLCYPKGMGIVLS
ncbi:MAG: phosphohydrolase [Bacteroidetes bacterium]|nr:phosphohydrolase [Bacteroidota bacterium]